MPRSGSAQNVRANRGKPEDVYLELKGAEVHLTISNRHYRVRGLERNMSAQQLRVNIMATRDELVHLDTFDLCKANSRTSFIRCHGAL